MYIYHALINALSAHMIHINRNTIFYIGVEDSPSETTDIRHYMETHTHTHKQTHTHTHTHTNKHTHTHTHTQLKNSLSVSIPVQQKSWPKRGQ